jgi:hypothetical protein
MSLSENWTSSDHLTPQQPLRRNDAFYETTTSRLIAALQRTDKAFKDVLVQWPVRDADADEIVVENERLLREIGAIK